VGRGPGGPVFIAAYFVFPAAPKAMRRLFHFKLGPGQKYFWAIGEQPGGGGFAFISHAAPRVMSRETNTWGAIAIGGNGLAGAKAFPGHRLVAGPLNVSPCYAYFVDSKPGEGEGEHSRKAWPKKLRKAKISRRIRDRTSRGPFRGPRPWWGDPCGAVHRRRGGRLHSEVSRAACYCANLWGRGLLDPID